MPALAANQVTLAEVLEVKGVPLNEEEIWAVLCQAGNELKLLLAQGKGKIHGQPSLSISPETLILSYSGQVKVAVSTGREKSKNVTYRAPELSSRTVSPSDGAVEKMYVYSMGMTAYFAAEYEHTKSKMAKMSVSLGNLLLCMCEELARARYTLRQVLEACGSKYGERSYRKIIKSLVVLVLGNNIPEVSQDDRISKPRSMWKSYSSDDQHPSRTIRSRYGSSLELPSPPLVQRVTRGQATTAEHVGSNDRATSSPEEHYGYHSQNNFMTKIPHTLDKYRKYLEKARHKKTENATSPVVADRSIGLNNRYGSMPAMNGRHSLDLELPSRHYRFERAQSFPEEDKGYNEGGADGLLSRSRGQLPRLADSRSFGNDVHSSDASSETSSLSDIHKSTLDSAQSSSLVSLMEGSYVPGSSITDHGSDLWGSMGSLRDNNGLGHSDEWHRSSLGDLRSVSELSNTDHSGKKYNGFTDVKQRPVNNGQLDKQRKYRSEHNLASPDSSDGGMRQRKLPKTKLRKFFGPEFVQVTQDPDRSLVNITPKKDKKRVSGRRLVTVVMLNEQKLEMAVESNIKVQELFTQITKYIGVTEKIYFGLARLEDNELFFLDFDSKLSKFAPSGWKESKKSTTEYTLFFRVKFYVENVSLLRHQTTTHQFYLQLRSDILYDRFRCDDEPTLNLVSLALQAEYGDYSRKRFGENYFKPRHYLSSRVLVKMGHDSVLQKLCSLHKVQCGLEQDKAESKFIKQTQKLAEYGMHFYKTKWANQENQSIYLGICVRGVTVFELIGNNKSPVERHSWQMIKKLAFKKKKFLIAPRTEGNSGKANKITFLNSSYKKSKYLLYMCTSFHRFQMRMKVRLITMDDTSKDTKGRSSLSLPYKSRSSDHLSGRARDGEPSVNGSVGKDGVDGNLEGGNENSRGSSRLSGEEVNGNNDPSHAPRNHETPTRTSPYILESSPTPPLQYSERTPSPRQGRGTADVILSPDRKVKVVRLRKDSTGALGLTVVGGEDTRRLHIGIFIKKITPGSAADQDGRLQMADRILAVNGKSLEYVSHVEAVQTLKNAPVEVELLVSQSTKTEGDIDLSALASPVVDKHSSSLSGDERTSPNPFQEKSPPVHANSSRKHPNHDAPAVSLDRPADSPRPPPYKIIHRQRRTSASSSDFPVSNPSSPEPGARVKPRGGVKLPGMQGDRVVHNADQSRNGLGTSSRPAEVPEGSPGSIASFGQKVHRKSFLTQPIQSQEPNHVVQNVSLGGALGDMGLEGSRSNSGVRHEDEEGTDGGVVTRGDSRKSDISGRARTPSGRELEHERRRNSESDLLQDSQFTVELDKESGSLGLNVTGGTNTSVRDGAIYVKSLYPNGPADLDGRIQIGYKIISVNGISLQGVTHKQAVETIKRAPLHTVLVVEGPALEEDSPSVVKQDDNLTQSDQNENESIFEVVLVKGIGGLGMSLVGGADYIEEYGEAIRIKAMFPGQPAMNSDELRIGDIILAANGTSLEGKTNRDAINVLRDQPQRVALTIKRDPSSIPPGLLRRGSFSQSLDPGEVLSVIHSKLRKENSGESQLSVYVDMQGYEPAGETRGPRGSLEGDPGEKSHEYLRRGSGDEEDAEGNMMVRDDDEALPRQQFVGEGVASLASSVEDLPSLPPPPDGFDDDANDGDVIEDTAGQGNYRRRSSAFSGMLEHVESTKSTLRTSSEASVLSPDGNKKEKLAPDEEVIDLVLYKGSGGLGFTLAGGADTTGGCFVRDIIGDPARSDGRLRPKDQIVMVNGQDTTNKKHMEAVDILRATRKEVHLVVRRRPDKVKSRTKDGINIKTVSIIRTTRGRIGLTLAEDKEGQIVAEDVTSDEPAAKEGGLKRGDIILEINGERVDEAGLQFAEQCLNKAGPVVTIVIKQFRSETESKYVLRSPTESEQDHQVAKPPELLPHEHDTPEQRRLMYSQDKYTTEQHPQEKRPHEQPLQVRQSQTQQAEVLPHGNQPHGNQPHGNQSSRHSTSERLPPGSHYSRYNSLESFESPEPAQFHAKLKASSSNNSVKEDQLSAGEEVDRLADAREEPGNEDYQSDDEEEEEDISTKEEILVTTLEKGPRGLGFSLFSGKTIHDTPGLFIRNIQANSVVAEDGKIKMGDQLLKVNDENVETLNHSEVITMLRRLSGQVKLEMLRILDADEEDDISSSLVVPPGPDEAILPSVESSPGKVINQELLRENERDVATATSPDFTQDLNIVLHALDKNQNNRFPAVKSEQSLNEPAESTLDSRISSQSSLAISAARLSHAEPKPSDEQEESESWPQPPETLELQTSSHSQETPVVVQSGTRDSDHNDNFLTTSEDDNVSITFSEDGFLDQLEDSEYTPSPETEAKRPGFGLGGGPLSPDPTLGGRTGSSSGLDSSQNLGISIDGNSSGLSRISANQPSSVAKDLRAGLNNTENLKRRRNSSASGEESIEMSLFKTDDVKDTAYLSTSAESTPTGYGASRVSPLIPESFLDASQAISPEVPPPVPSTPIPSDDDLAPKPPERVQSLAGMRGRGIEESVPKGRFDYSLRSKSPLVLRRSPSTKPTGPLIEISQPSARYSGECLKHVVRKLEDAIHSGQAGNEYQALREIKAVDSCPSGKRALNKEKNRYKNVLPFEKTRVILSGDEQMDYINANYIDITVGSDVYHYIATQGPLPITATDFWRMVWEQKSRVIAMVTLDMEGGKVKCHRYWPESPELPLAVGNSLEVHLEAVEMHTNYVQRQIKIKNIENSECLKVTHLNFVAWPDHGVPKSTYELVDFIKQIRSYSNTGPCVIHCSAGIGRTGTLLTIETCLRHIESGLEFNIYRIVRELREQRPGMIQTKDQYLLCYQACVEVLKSLEGHT